MKPSKRQSGFTLIEVLLALGIFAIIGIATVRHLQQIINTKGEAFHQIDFYNAVRSTIAIMREDLSQAFHIKYEDLSEENKASVQQNVPTPHTLFDGRPKELVFTSLSHRVYYTGKRECEQTEISFFLMKKPGREILSLMKRESEFIDADLYKGGKVITLIDDVTDLTFRYWDEKQDKWVDDWFSDGGGTLDRFPLSVKMRLVLKGDGGKTFETETEFKLANPNNENPFKKL